MFKNFLTIIFIFVFFIININSYVIQENFSKAELLEVEHELQNNLSEYLEELKQKLAKIKLGLLEMRRFVIKGDIVAQCSDPLHSFLLLRHMHADWPKWHQLLQTRVGVKQMKYLQKTLQIITKKNYLKDATIAMLRIQEAYSLATSDIANGLLAGRQYAAKLSVLDCFEIGLVEYNAQIYDNAAQWFELVLQKYQVEHSKVTELLGLRLTDICLLQTKLFLEQNIQTNAQQCIERALEMKTHSKELLRLKLDLWTNSTKSLEIPTRLLRTQIEMEYFDRDCGRKFERASKLFCFYQKSSTPLLKLAPFKLELLSIDPYIVLYHEVLYDSEIKHIKAEVTPHLKPATTTDLNYDNIISDVRVSDAHWLDDKYSPVTITVNQRISDMTNCILDNAELMQIIRYGAGEHFFRHVDYADDDNVYIEFSLNRLATALFYMTDVIQGGATIFPSIGLKVYPQKGSALLWHNLDNACIGHKDTVHGSCPVIVGTKWVISKWIDVGSQMFTMPCLKMT